MYDNYAHEYSPLNNLLPTPAPPHDHYRHDADPHPHRTRTWNIEIFDDIFHYKLAYGSAQVAASMAVSVCGMCVTELAVAHSETFSWWISIRFYFPFAHKK